MRKANSSFVTEAEMSNACEANSEQVLQQPQQQSQPDTLLSLSSSLSFDFELLRAKIERGYKQTKISRRMRKYYRRRYQLLSRFDEGALLDIESWYSVTPEKLAEHIARKCFARMGYRRDLTVLDAFCGAGGNTIQFAAHFDSIIANDIDFVRLQCAQHNAHNVYELRSSSNTDITFMMQDFFRLHLTLNRQVDFVFLSPPWGGTNYTSTREADISEMPLDCFRIFMYCLRELKCPNVAFFLPRNTKLEQLIYMAGPGGRVEIEQNWLGSKLVAITAYYGELCARSLARLESKKK
jgi:trimethylguanosine synthase